jgi:bifunctional enzyme CysN/CysC
VRCGLGRGEVLVGPDAPATVATELRATVCWMTDRPLIIGARYGLKAATRSVRAIVTGIEHRIDINTLGRIEGVTALGLNEIGVVALQLSAPLAVDAYRDNRATGSFILIDEATFATAGAGMIGGSR